MNPERCRGTLRNGSPCRQRLFDWSAAALRAGATLQAKCPKCNHLNTFRGTEG